MESSFKFPRSERLKSRKRISQLFQKGDRIKAYPIRAFVAKQARLDVPDRNLQVAFSAPKRNFKKAIQRNRIKRLMREAYRTSPLRFDLLDQHEITLDIIFIYMGKEIPSFSEVQRATNVLLERLKSYA